jgi:hypothetical protein
MKLELLLNDCNGQVLPISEGNRGCTPIRYGRIASVSATDEVTQFLGPHKIPYAPVHNSSLLTKARQSALNQHKRGLTPWGSEFQIRPLTFLPIQYSPFSPNCPARSHIKPFYQLYKVSTFQISNQGTKSPKSREWNMSLDFYHSSIR